MDKKDNKMSKAQKKTLLWRYIGSFVLLAVTILVIAWMYKQAEKDDAAKAAAESTQIVTEQSAE